MGAVNKQREAVISKDCAVISLVHAMGLNGLAGPHLHHLDPHSSCDATLGTPLALLIQNPQTHRDHRAARLS